MSWILAPPNIWNPTQLLCLMCPNRRWLPAPSGMLCHRPGKLPLLSLLLPPTAFPARLRHGCPRPAQMPPAPQEQVWERQVLPKAHLPRGQGKGWGGAGEGKQTSDGETLLLEESAAWLGSQPARDVQHITSLRPDKLVMSHMTEKRKLNEYGQATTGKK